MDFETLSGLTDFYFQELDKSPEALEFLRFRGVGKAQINQWKLGFSPWDADLTQHFDRHSLIRCGVLESDRDRLEGRIIFPERLPHGQVVGFCGRSLDPRATKYVTTRTTDYYRRSEHLFGLYRLETEEPGQIMLCEGPFDAIAVLKEHPAARVVSVGGSRVSDHQVALIRRYIGLGDVFLAFDRDDAGRRGVELFRRKHGFRFRRVTEVLLPAPFSDPAEWLQAESKDRGILRYREHKGSSSKTANGGETGAGFAPRLP